MSNENDTRIKITLKKATSIYLFCIRNGSGHMLVTSSKDCDKKISKNDGQFDSDLVEQILFEGFLDTVSSRIAYNIDLK